MLQGILLILKILGIILLIILGILLFLLGALLFGAVTWRLEAEKKESFRIFIRGSWMFRLLTVRYVLDQAPDWKQDLELRILGIPVFRPFAEDKKKTSGEAAKRKKGASGKKAVPPLEASEKKERERAAEEKSPNEKMPDFREGEKVRKIPEPISEPVRPLRLTERIRRFFGGLCDRLKELGARFQSLRERKDEFLEFWRLEAHVRARSAILKELRYLLKKLKPVKLQGRLRFGLEDPSVTGWLMGVLSILCSWYPGSFELCPDFEQEILEGRLNVKGRIRLYVFLRVFRKVYFNQDIRHMYRQWKA